jgi:hypothetical protein
MFRAAAVILLFGAASAASNTHVEHARWMVHNLTYGVLSTTSTEFPGVAFGNPQSFVDGTIDNSTGHLYLYVSGQDASMIDIAQNPEVSFTLSQEMLDNYCSSTNLDPEDPLCVRVVLIGKADNVTADVDTWAKNALFERHPAMKSWPDDHSFYVMTIELKSIWVIDAFGGATSIKPAEFFAAELVAPPARNGTAPAKPPKAPLFTEKAKTARWMSHHLDYGVLSTTSTDPAYKGVAFGNPQSVADDSAGHFYFYMTTMDASARDLMTSTKASWALSEQMLAGYCTNKKIDPEDPRCARCVFTGEVRNATATEIPTAKAVLFAKHPEMKEWPADHSFTFYTMDIEHIWLIDMFGGASNVKPTDYYKAKP